MSPSRRRQASYTVRYRIPKAFRALRENWRDSRPLEWKPSGLTSAEVDTLLTEHMDEWRHLLRREGLTMFDTVEAHEQAHAELRR